MYSNALKTQYSEQLFVIYLAALAAESNLFNNLYNNAYAAANECSTRFNDPAFSIFKQTASTFVTHAAAAGGGIAGAFVGAVAGTAITSSLGVYC